MEIKATTIEIKATTIEMVPIEKLVDHPRNNNKHSDEQISRLAKLIQHTGFRDPLTVSKRSGFIIAGHCRKQAALKTGLTELPVCYQDFDSEAEEYQYLTADNEIARWAELDHSDLLDNIKELGLADSDLELFGLPELKELKELDDENEDEVPTDVDTRCKKGDVWLLGEHRLMCGDSTSIDAVDLLMNGEKADMVFTDPPYGGKIMGKAVGKESGFNKAINKIERDVDFISNFDPCAFLNVLECVNPKSYYICTNLFLLEEYLRDDSKILVWAKGHGMPSVGNYNSDLEFIVYSKNDGAIFNKGLSEASYSRLIQMPKKDRDLHPTMKPIALIENCLKISSKVNSMVLDLFGGSGSTLIACEKTNRKCFMMELDEQYCDVILTRWEKYTGKTAERLDGPTP